MRVLRSPVTSLIALGIAVTAISLSSWGLRPFGGPYDPVRAGTWADFAGVAFSGAAVLIAVWALVREGERERVARRTGVYCWLDPAIEEQSGAIAWALAFQNDTSTPIYTWKIETPDGSLDRRSDRYGPIRPGPTRLKMASLAGTAVADAPKISLHFIDAEGTAWSRSASGVLTKGGFHE